MLQLVTWQYRNNNNLTEVQLQYMSASLCQKISFSSLVGRKRLLDTEQMEYIHGQEGPSLSKNTTNVPFLTMLGCAQTHLRASRLDSNAFQLPPSQDQQLDVNKDLTFLPLYTFLFP